MLVTFVAFYLLVSIGIGLYAATRVKNTTDYVAAGRHLPLYIVTATVFATWFGSETVVGISATFLQEGLRGLWSDPFGASLCLILVGLFFARPLYRLNLLTLGDYYRMRYGRTVEVLCSLAIVISYLGWVSAQITALGLVFNILSDGAISNQTGMLIGIAVVLAYTLFGGMWSVALTDFMQMTIIVVGLFYIAWVVSGMAGGVDTVVAHAEAAGRFNFLPAFEPRDIMAFLAGILTMGFGSIPQQDVFQRVNAARSERIAVTGSILGGSGYFVFAFVPIFIAYSATLIDPALMNRYIDTDAQMILPQLILQHMPLFAQVMFFGALLSAIMSTASGTLLAPSVTFSENILRNTFSGLDDRQFLWLNRVVVVVFAVFVLWYALQTDESIHGMVEDAYKVTLATAFAPLAVGLYWKRATTQGALASIVTGFVVWLGLEAVAPEALIPPHFAGMLAGLVAIVAGSLAPQRIRPAGGHAHHLSLGQPRGR
ncbi:sodium:solute symporter [Nitrogeniibacter mangrovi]|uniref:Sodium:solute symporter n=1 Tax=Nitrogeniibacter mangrovi TaxID=2016596 RepID=A0A6C1AYV5_9RHOO|nr:sodium:solute symporter family protein [Nitrogeniibacter mangrovi]QID16536.1 sodium:solute symporter [Nitrogeniibacter mangrovi]